ncbi:MAG: 3-deoxy-7-phosphoheptulonate synthase [Victivallaceae bacterium]|nr:3-deoxy-7-phosphoheptulonate synthase [Victivallaceae bacterium]
MRKTNNINISSSRDLPAPGEISSELPLSLPAAAQVTASRDEIKELIQGKKGRFMLIVGPCSIHDPAGAIEYARRLKALSDKVSDRIMIVMRVYFEKPRTTIGWKGLIYDPDINGSYNIAKGIFIARKLLLEIVDLGLPVATEMLDPILAQYIADAVSWAAIGARTTESQTHRQLASGLSMPVGFKNATDGGVQVALDAIATAAGTHSFIGVSEATGHVGVFRTKGNKFCHIVLRGGPTPNFGAEYIAFVRVAVAKRNLNPGIIVDCSHANSGKDPARQHLVLEDLMRQKKAEGQDCIIGAMLESYLSPGCQKIVDGVRPKSDVSITDACIGWEETEKLVLDTYGALA